MATSGCPGTASGTARRDAGCPACPGRRSCARATRLRCLRSAAPAREALLYDFHDRLVPYEQAWAWQKQRLEQLCSRQGDVRDTVILLQHPPVYTLGAGSTQDHLRFDPAHPPHPLFRTERGGEVTYHGPGQLVMYPLLDLATHHQQDLHWYLRSLEEVVIRALEATSGLQGERVEGLTGVWVGGAKLAAIGVRARKWVTYHGLALNVVPDLAPFQHIVPCGIGDRPVGSVASALGRHDAAGEQLPAELLDPLAPAEGQEEVEAKLRQLLAANAAAGGAGYDAPPAASAGSGPARGTATGDATPGASTSGAGEPFQVHVPDPLLIEYRYALLDAFSEVFGLSLVAASSAGTAGGGGGSSSSSSSGSSWHPRDPLGIAHAQSTGRPAAAVV